MLSLLLQVLNTPGSSVQIETGLLFMCYTMLQTAHCQSAHNNISPLMARMWNIMNKKFEIRQDSMQKGGHICRGRAFAMTWRSTGSEVVKRLDVGQIWCSVTRGRK
jgi:hypothetical protein